MDQQQYSAICEQGDLGLNITNLTASENQAYQESLTPKQDVVQQPINEKKDVIH